MSSYDFRFLGCFWKRDDFASNQIPHDISEDGSEVNNTAQHEKSNESGNRSA